MKSVLQFIGGNLLCIKVVPLRYEFILNISKETLKPVINLSEIISPIHMKSFPFKIKKMSEKY